MLQRNDLRKKLIKARRNTIVDQTRIRPSRILSASGIASMGLKSVAGYIAMPGEADPSALLQALRSAGIRIGVVGNARKNHKLRFFLQTGLLKKQRTGAFGILVPGLLSAEIMPDLIIMPAVGITRTGLRMGMGGGFYDRTIAAYKRSGRRVITCVIVKKVQVCKRLSSAIHDQRFDYFISLPEYKLRSILMK